MNRLVTSTALVCLLLGTGSALAQRPDFSGMWTLDRDASEFSPPAFSGGRGGADVGRLFITHAKNGTLVIGAETNASKAWSYSPGRELSIPVGGEFVGIRHRSIFGSREPGVPREVVAMA